MGSKDSLTGMSLLSELGCSVGHIITQKPGDNLIHVLNNSRYKSLPLHTYYRLNFRKPWILLFLGFYQSCIISKDVHSAGSHWWHLPSLGWATSYSV